MPHLVLEYTRNLATAFDVPATLLKLNCELDAIGEYQSMEIKSRAVPLDAYVVGTTPQEQGFIHVQFSIMVGRSPQMKRQTCERLLQVLRQQVTPPLRLQMQMTVQIVDIDRDGYGKVKVGADV